ncbi:unnamed protein product [Rotaria sp. Silwood1]|nr:unnamed protein product [Rotaria sp. Silwood1]CAF1411330.1 unnamed protein product [Rotaria sp. Silwood1]CAF3528932.1 unnamed protein product [Rotaria sp. Silwood1]CAF3588616.1 unnamed protein product [Rotaria sp. Silwood1]CAF4671014.1 unnamed protein product [Rotaria sp. Silwood1]
MADENVQDLTTPRFIPSTRFIIALLVSFALFTQYAQRQSLSIAIVCMVNKTGINMEVNSTQNSTLVKHNTTLTPSVIDIAQIFKEKTFRWSEFEQQIILGAYWAGYILTLVPGGWLSMSIGAKRVFAYCLLTSSLATLALSVIYTMAETQVLLILIIVLRIIVGLGHGALFPATYTIWVSWAVPNERGTLTSISFSGTHVGTCFGYGSGYVVNFADVVPAYSSLLFGLSITFGSLASLSANILAGVLIKQPILSDWQYMFIIFIIVYTIGGVVYLMFGSAIPRKWATDIFEEHNSNIENEPPIDPSLTMLTA